MAGNFTLLLMSYILTVGLRDCGGRQFHSFTHICILTVGLRDCGGRQFHSFTLILSTDCGTAGLRDCGGKHFHSFINISYIDYGTAGLRWQAFSLSHPYLMY